MLQEKIQHINVNHVEHVGIQILKQ
jgi:hypothetical protein